MKTITIFLILISTCLAQKLNRKDAYQKSEIKRNIRRDQHIDKPLPQPKITKQDPRDRYEPKITVVTVPKDLKKPKVVVADDKPTNKSEIHLQREKKLKAKYDKLKDTRGSLMKRKEILQREKNKKIMALQEKVAKAEESRQIKKQKRDEARARAEKLKKPKDLEDILTETVEVTGGTFTMGIKDPESKTGEYPTFERTVKSFHMDKYPVTNFMFRKFITAKKRYRTHAEVSGRSHVLENFLEGQVKRDGIITNEHKPWILYVRGALWNRPEGGSSNTAKRLKEPVVHVSHTDAFNFCKWMGKRLPTESEWEYAARGGLKRVVYPWGDKFEPNRMNYWQGEFPHEDKKADGHHGLSPVDAFPPQNEFGIYDVLGNVWEWTDSRYYQRGIGREMQPVKYVVKGGSYLDSRGGHFNKIVRTANRMGHTPEFSAHFVGFRCVKTISEMKEVYVDVKPTTPNRSEPVHHRIANMYDQREVYKRREKKRQENQERIQERIKQGTAEYYRAGKRWTEDL